MNDLYGSAEDDLSQLEQLQIEQTHVPVIGSRQRSNAGLVGTKDKLAAGSGKQVASMILQNKKNIPIQGGVGSRIGQNDSLSQANSKQPPRTGTNNPSTNYLPLTSIDASQSHSPMNDQVGRHKGPHSVIF